MNPNHKKNKLIYWIFAAILLLYPFLHVNVGIDVTDTGFSLGSFLFEPQMGEEWVLFATYLANLTGTILTRLPFGDTMLGMNVYTSGFVSVTAFIVYAFLNKKVPAWIAFIGIFMAESLCWCPTIILYNYLTYFLLTILVVFLYKGLTEKRRYLFLAGVILGLNVMVRFPNLAQAAFILAVWYYGYLKKEKIGIIMQNTSLCVGGFLAGMIAVLIEISFQYGLSSYFSMITHLFTMGSSQGDGHSMSSMLYSILDAYLVAFRWMLFPIALTIVGILVFYLFRKRNHLIRVVSVFFFFGSILLFRLLYGRGMFNLKYYTYESMFQWEAIFLILSMLTMIAVIRVKNSTDLEKLLAFLVLLVVLITPLGSDNYLYPVINNLFLIAPITWYWLIRFGKSIKDMPEEKKNWFCPIRIMIYTILVITFVQSSLFGYTFVFRDGTQGEALDTKITENEVLRGMLTSSQKAYMLESVTKYAKESGLIGKEVILYGNIPAMSCFLQMPAALSTSWPDLATYQAETMEQEIAQLEGQNENPVVILSAAVGAWLTEDAQEMSKKGISIDTYKDDEKIALIRTFINHSRYQETFANDEFVIYEMVK